ncbi:MAG: response regulator [Anaerolineaceae bacterium]|nr:response regulator [Anaerolineaceae bacterium]
MWDNFILLVEDNPDDEELTLRAIKESKVTNPIVVVRDGAEALDYLFCTGVYAGRDRQITPQVILLDLQLPKMGGLEVLERLRADAHTRLLPVVVLTSSSEDADIFNSYRLGANSFVRKPVEYQKFIDAVSQLGKYWVHINEPPPYVK